jgi:hypothetical protein
MYLREPDGQDRIDSQYNFRSTALPLLSLLLPVGSKHALRKLTLLVLVLLFGGAASAMADPVSVDYTVTQISGSEWQYEYSLSGSFVAGDDLAIYFPLASSAGLVDLGTGGPDCTTFAFQPDPSLPADGEFDMLANVTNPDLTPVFSVEFLYSGAGTPGVQAFTLYDPDFNVLATGFTDSGVPSPVPEPASFVLIGSGLAAIWKLKRNRC